MNVEQRRGACPVETANTPRPHLPLWLRVGLGAVILAGVALRVAYPSTTAFCNDQARACALAEDIAQGGWPTAGLVNSGGFRNPPGFVYLLAAVWKLAPDPLALLAFINIVNVVALGLSAYLLARWFGPAAAWWGTSFMAAAPWAIQYCRWIWAQDLLFPSSVLVFVCLWAWLCEGRRWASLGVVLGLGLQTQIHLIGVVPVLATVLLLIWRRPRWPLAPLLLGMLLAGLAFLPYIWGGHVRSPESARVGYGHAWRVVPAAAMSVCGLGWSLEFKGGYAGFVHALSWRRWPYEVVMGVPVILLAWGLARAAVTLWRQRARRAARTCSPLLLVVALTALIPVSFALLAIRASPTYLPLWYPLPFAAIGWVLTRPADAARPARAAAARSLISALLLGVLFVELAFFAEQLHYIRRQGGVPGSIIDRSYGPLRRDLESLAARAGSGEVWATYEGASPIMSEPVAYLLRRVNWPEAPAGRTLVRYAPWSPQVNTVACLPQDWTPDPSAYLVRPWNGPQQVDAQIPRQPRERDVAVAP